MTVNDYTVMSYSVTMAVAQFAVRSLNHQGRHSITQYNTHYSARLAIHLLSASYSCVAAVTYKMPHLESLKGFIRSLFI